MAMAPGFGNGYAQGIPVPRNQIDWARSTTEFMRDLNGAIKNLEGWTNQLKPGPATEPTLEAIDAIHTIMIESYKLCEAHVEKFNIQKHTCTVHVRATHFFGMGIFLNFKRDKEALIQQLITTFGEEEVSNQEAETPAKKPKKESSSQSRKPGSSRTEAQRTLATDDDGGFTIMEDTSVESYSLPPLQFDPDAKDEEVKVMEFEGTQELTEAELEALIE